MSLDRYVWRIALGAFAAALLFFTFLTILVDLLNNVAKYTDKAAEQGLGGFDLIVMLGLYYLKLVPVVVTTVAPFATVIACMFAVARLQHANEMVPMLFVGRSMQRVLRPMLGLGVMAGLLMASSWQWIVPHVGADLAAVESFLRDSNDIDLPVYERRDEGRYFHARKFHPATKELEGVVLLLRGALVADTVLVRAPSASWDEQAGDWRLVGGISQVETAVEGIGEERPIDWLGQPELTPELLLKQGRNTRDLEKLSYSDLLELIAANKHRPELRLALHRHITWPLANVLLLLLVLPMAVHFERGSRVGRVLAAIGLCAGYFLLDLICQAFGQRNIFHPVVMAWTPPIVFGSLGAVLFGGLRT